MWSSVSSFKIHVTKILNKCVVNYISVSRIMPKKSLQGPPRKKFKHSHHSTTMPKSGSKSKNSRTLETNKIENVHTNFVEAVDAKSTTKDVKNVPIVYLDTPVKSANDKKDYRVIRLPNGLTALLISDVNSIPADQTESDDDDDDEWTDDEDEEDDEEDEEEEEDDDEIDGHSIDEDEGRGDSKRPRREEKMAACGLCVGVGSFSDPPEIPGMAHFLEHMVFMGSEKYPEENDFDSFITKRGGSDNASTECEQTTFHFEIQEKHLLAALDRFAQFFISPLMKRDAISREREAIESEFQMALPSDFYRKEQLFCSLAQPGHPATKFTWGNLVSLRDNVADDKLYEEVHKFRQRHYSAHRMTLALQARLPLETLEQYVKECFSDVPTNGLPSDDFTKFQGIQSFDTPSFRRIYKIKPVKDVCQAELTWVMPSLQHLYKCKPHQYISWIVGHEGKGSLISYLRKKMWCLDIFSGNGESGFEHSSMYALFSLSLILTSEGHEHIKEVLDAVFSYITLMRKSGPQKRIYDEIHQTEETNFRFIDEISASDYVENLSENMHCYAPADYITGSDLYFDYNEAEIRACMEALRPETVNVIIFDKKFDDADFEKVEPWFGTKYTDTEIPNDWIKDWQSIEPLPEFHLPEPNIFLTSDFGLIPLPEEVPKYPVKVHSDCISEVWYRPDPKFRIPECYMYFYLVSPLALTTPQNAAMIDLLVLILKHLLVEELYPAIAAELNYQIYASDKGLVVKVNGFNQKLPLLLTTITKYIADCSTIISPELFNVMKVEQAKDYYNTFVKPGKLVKQVRMDILMLVHWTSIKKHAAIADIGYEEFLSFAKHFVDHIYVNCLVQGNMTKEDVVENAINCAKVLKCGSLLPNTMPQLRVLQIPLGVHCCRVENFNKADVNSVITNYYQSGKGDVKISVIIELLIMLMEEPLFNQLRTQEQLGYNVMCQMRDTFGVFGYSVTVCTQADKFTTNHVDQRIEVFLKSFLKTLKKMSDKELNDVKVALIKLKQCVDLHLKEEVNRNWSEIESGDYIFDRLDREIDALNNIKLGDLKKWMEKHVIGGVNLRKLSVQIVGTKSAKVCPKDPSNETEKEVQDQIQSLDDEDTESRCSAIEYGSDVKFSLEYVTSVEGDDLKKNAKSYVTDIENFKHKLYAYPVNRSTEDNDSKNKSLPIKKS